MTVCGLIILTLISGGIGEFLVVPINTAVLNKNSAFFNCSQEDVVQSSWAHYYGENGVALNIFVGNFDTGHPRQENYDLETDGTPYLYNLLIFEADSETSGQYRCQGLETLTVSRYAELIVLNETECGDDKEEGWEYVEGEHTTFTCSVEYAGRWPPSLRWSQQTNNNDSSSQSDNDTVNSSFTIQLSASHHGDRFTCLTHFDEMDDVKELEADNVPDFHSECQTSPLNVLYAPQGHYLTDGTYWVGGSVLCVADANPSTRFSDYNWMTSGTGALVYTGQRLTFTTKMAGDLGITCCASVFIRGEKVPGCEEFQVHVDFPDISTPARPDGPVATGNCSVITGEWESAATDEKLRLTLHEDSSLTGLYNPAPNSGWYGVEGGQAVNEPTLGFVVIGQGGDLVSSWAGQCYTCDGGEREVIHMAVITYVYDQEQMCNLDLKGDAKTDKRSDMCLGGENMNPELTTYCANSDSSDKWDAYAPRQVNFERTD